jgi:Protein of unknown function (DUF2905)
MDASQSAGIWLVRIGAIVILIGLLVWTGAFRWFGHLPGDIRIERGDVHVYAPITSMIAISIVLTLVLNVLRRFF